MLLLKNITLIKILIRKAKLFSLRPNSIFDLIKEHMKFYLMKIRSANLTTRQQEVIMEMVEDRKGLIRILLTSSMTTFLKTNPEHIMKHTPKVLQKNEKVTILSGQ